MAQDDTRGPVPPYGPPIWAAINRGDPAEMREVAEAARAALSAGQAGGQAGGAGGQAGSAGGAPSSGRVRFSPVDPGSADEVREALAELDKRIAGIRNDPKG